MTPSNATGSILFTIGHSNHDLGDFLAILVRHGVEALCDVRSRPGSFRFPQFNREPLEAAAACAKIQYQFLGGILDFMSRVSFLRTVESASGVGELGSDLNDRSASFTAILAALQAGGSRVPGAGREALPRSISKNGVPAIIPGSSAAVGSRIVPSEEVDRAFGMPAGKLRDRAGIESLAHAAEGENELTLGTRAAQEALRAAACGAQQLDWIIATSETHHDYPSLSAQLHSRLLLREDCGALDVGGSTLAGLGVTESEMSLVTVTAAVSDFVASAWLVAVTCTFAGEGKSAGAVYTPPGVIVPVAALPPAVPFTLQFTRIRRVCYRGGKGRRISEQHRPALWRDRNRDGRRRWRRGHCRACASPAAALRPRPRREKCGENSSRTPEFLFPDLRERPHTLRNAGEGPAKNSCHIEMVLDVGIETLLL